MSLINDALKRASKKPTHRPDLPPAVPAMKPVEERGGRLNAGIIAGLVVACIVVGFLLLRPRQSDVTASGKPNVVASGGADKAPASNPSQPPEAVVAKAPEPDRAPVRSGSENAAAASAEPVKVTPAPVEQAQAQSDPKPAESADTVEAVSAAASTVTPAAAPEPVEASELRLQAIYFRLKNPTALISGKTVAVGQQVGNARVVAIHRTSVEIDIEGRKETLTLK